MRVLGGIIAFLFLGVSATKCSAMGLPSHLVPCYRGNNTHTLVAQTDQIFLELIRKIEDALPTAMDIRTLSAGLFHGLRYDGVQKAVGISESELVTPYAPNGIMAPKLELLKRLISVHGNVPFADVLSESEVCILHKIISNSVEPLERGDETRTCPTYSMSSVNAPWITSNVQKINDTFRLEWGANTRNIVKFGRAVSQCPFEMGVAKTTFYGDLSMGTLIGAIAAGLEPQSVQISDLIGSYHDQYQNQEDMDERPISRLFRNLNTIDNQLAAGLAGDLAEVCVYQTPFLGKQFVMGTGSWWNDTLFPRTSLLEENHRARWEFTEAELLSGLDSFFISGHIREWVNQLRRLRLSQVIEMYYSPRGIPSRAIETSGHKSKTMENMKEYMSILRDTSGGISSSGDITSACHRAKILQTIDVGRLQDETFNFAQVLQFTATSLYMSEEKLRASCDHAVNVFLTSARKVLQKQTYCNSIPKWPREPVLNLWMNIEGSRSQYENLKLVNHISHLAAVARRGSNITVLHGSTGAIISEATASIVDTMTRLKDFEGRNPTTISLTQMLQTLHERLQLQTTQEMQSRAICAPSHAVLIISQGSRVGTTDFESAQRLITTTFQRFPDLYFIFVTDDKQTFSDLTRKITAPSHWSGNVERFNELIYPEHFSIIETRGNIRDPKEFTEQLLKEFRRIPKRIIVPYCTETDRQLLLSQNILFRPDEYEDYVNPAEELLYRISPYYFRYATEITVQFLGVNYGDLTICQSRGAHTKPDLCQSLKGSEMVWFNETRPCPDPLNCQSIYFSVSVDETRMRCTENDCRFPDQVRFILRHSGLTCESNASNRLLADLSLITVFILLLIINRM